VRGAGRRQQERIGSGGGGLVKKRGRRSGESKQGTRCRAVPRGCVDEDVLAQARGRRLMT